MAVTCHCERHELDSNQNVTKREHRVQLRVMPTRMVVPPRIAPTPEQATGIRTEQNASKAGY